MRVDGGAAANDLLMDFQANLSDLVVERPAELESTARGAAMLAGLGVGLFRAPRRRPACRRRPVFSGQRWSRPLASSSRQEWKQAVQRARS